MELQQLNYFKAVAEIGKISDAAESLFISAPALSTSISRLEKELGFALFDRTNNKILLNQQGQILLKYVSRMFSTLDSAMQEMQQSLIHQGQHISIVCVSGNLWVDLITAFTSEYPRFTLSCAATALKDLTEIGLSPQYSFLLAPENDIPSSYANELDSIPIFEIYPTVMLHRDHPLAQESVIHLRQLSNEKIFMPTPGYSLHDRLVQLFDLFGVPVPADNAYTLLARRQMVKQKLGVSFSSMYPGYTPPMALRNVRLEDPFGPWTARLYWRKNKSLTKDEKVFRDFVEAFYSTQH